MDAAPGGVGERLPATALSRNPTQSLFDLASARALNRTLHSAFEESAIFRIDHYLAKEAVQNLLYFRFANSFLEPIWNRNYVDSVQVVGFLAIEPPAGGDDEALHNEQVKVLPIDPAADARTSGARSVPGLPRRGWRGAGLDGRDVRWAGVPFYIRAGKALPVTATEVIVELKAPPHDVFREPHPGPPNHLRFRLGARDGHRRQCAGEGARRVDGWRSRRALGLPPGRAAGTR